MQAFDIKKWILPVLGLVLLIGWFFLLFQKNQKRIGTLHQRLVYLESEAKKNILESRIQDMKHVGDSLRISLNQKENRIFPKRNFQELGKKVEQMVGQYGLKLVSITPDYESLKVVSNNAEAISELPFQMELKGNFSQFTKWIDNLGGIPFAIKFNDFFLTREAAKSSALRMELKGVVLLGTLKPGGNEDEKKAANTKKAPAKKESPS